MYDYLAKIILLGPSGTGKFVANSAALHARRIFPFGAHIADTRIIDRACYTDS